jgi:hypothetical protein
MIIRRLERETTSTSSFEGLLSTNKCASLLGAEAIPRIHQDALASEFTPQPNRGHHFLSGMSPGHICNGRRREWQQP